MKVQEKIKRIEQLEDEIKRLRVEVGQTSNDVLRHLPTRIGKERKLIRMTQEEMAHKLNMSRPQIANIEAGRSGITLKVFVQICITFGLSADKLLGLKE